MRRQPLAAALLGALLLTGCRSEEIALGFDPPAEATYRFRYDVVGTITTTVEGEAPTVAEVRSTLDARQQVVEVTSAGVLVEVELRRDGGAPRTVLVVLDRAGSLQGVQAIEAMPATAFELPSVGSMVASDAAAPPIGPLVLGERWRIDDGGVTGEARLDRLGIIDRTEVAEVTATLHEAIDERTTSGGSDVALEGTLRSEVVTAYDLVDGAIRRARTHTAGTVRARVAAPDDVVAEAVDATIRYDLDVETRRLS